MYDIPERKNAFQGDKNKNLKKSKNWHFSKGVTYGFGPKMAIFPWFWFINAHFSIFFLGSIDKENVFYDILERQKRHSRL